MQGVCTGMEGECTGMEGECTGMEGECTGMEGECAAVVREVEEERECCYRQMWDRMFMSAARMVPLAQQSSCRHAHELVTMHAWICAHFLGIRPQVRVRDVSPKACKLKDREACVLKEWSAKVEAMNLFKSFETVVERMHARHLRRLASLHPKCEELMWQQVQALRAKMHDVHAILYRKLVQKFWGHAPFPPVQLRCTTPRIIIDNSTGLKARTDARRVREAEWQAWRAWFLNRMNTIRQRRARNAARLLHTLNW